MSSLLPALSLVFGGCCSNVLFLEELLRIHPGLGDLMTATQFAFVTVEGAMYLGMHRRASREWQPVSEWIVPSLLYFAVNVLNNRVWQYDVSVPLHTIVRSSTVLVTACLGLLSGERYSLGQLAGVALVGVGTVICTLWNVDLSGRQTTVHGLAILSLATVLAVAQTSLSAKRRASPRENLFYTHAIGLPLFVALHKPIIAQWATLTADGKWWLAANCLSQYICVRGVSMLLPAGPLTVNIVLALRKFASLVLSAVIFGNVNRGTTFGGLFVFSGALLYSHSTQTR